MTPAGTTDVPVYGLHYGGAWRAAHSRKTLEIRSPASRALLSVVPDADAEDVAAAAQAAQEGFERWSRLDVFERARHLHALAALIRQRVPDLAELESAITGRPIREMRAQMGRIPEWIEYFASIALGLEGESNRVKGDIVTLTHREPFGVCALLTPWNHPILILVKKFAAALAAGNTCLVKPSELAPVSTLIFAQWCHEAGLPDGVISVVTGGAEAGALVCAHPAVQRIDLTGGTTTGRRVAAAAAERLVPCTLELGGKAPVIVFEDADIQEAAAGAVFSAFIAAGQTCVSATRFLIAAPIYERFLDAFGRRIAQLKLGDPSDVTTDVGPVISQSSCVRAYEHIETAKAEGARLVVGGERPVLPPPFDEGFFVPPTLFADVTPGMRLFREEVFGPVVCVSRFESEAEALALANDSPYALGAAVWTRDVARAHRVSLQVRAGVVWVNDHHKNDPRSIWGGYGESGYGKENGWDALESYMRKRSVVIRTAPSFDDWFAGGKRYG
ncbi:aldehyde dehydrogenase family protein [Ancylobacter sp. A5.8]|uniref:aldehyde dehydrogenase family protein n=1 Tax=Ancylobacter gelatini TaxID=2919920 RepID=UPI001F4EE9F4|nr:aldehyde dehydrogenase family protein [Ancylobacter gelatini]MCJ8142628.1 aldehyde dehydrogenase family protein [Ancylobacter gelatini]